MGRIKRRLLLGLMMCAICGSAVAADLYSSGTKDWDTTSANWGTVFGGPYNTAAWNNLTPDAAYIEGTLGSHTVTLTEDISVTNLTFYDNTSSNGPQSNARDFIVAGRVLNFAPGGEIRAHLTRQKQQNPGSSVTISSGITGSPSVWLSDSGYLLTLAPGGTDTMTLGQCFMPYEAGIWDKCTFEMSGSSTGNTIQSIGFLDGNKWGTCFKKGPGSWTVTGNIVHGGLTIEEGNMYVSGEIDMQQSGFILNGGVFHYNHAGVFKNGSFNLNNGSLDNSSGSAINSSTYNRAMTWGGNWVFIGSLGASSDVNLGTGAVTLTGNRTITVSNVLTTVTVEGVIDDGVNLYGITKGGAGALKLTATSTYNGDTTVAEGTLSLSQPYLDDDAFLNISNGATLNLNYTGTDAVFMLVIGGSNMVAGTWGGTTSSATYKTNTITGSGIINNLGGLAPAGIWYWDGPNVGGTGDGSADGGAGTWSTANANWDGGVTARSVWNNTTNDFAYFRTASGAVDLQSDIILTGLQIDQVDGYTIGSNPETQTLNFGGTNRSITVDGVTATIRAGITGQPDVYTPNGFREHVYFTPDSVDMHLGDVTIGIGSSSNPELHLQGTTTGNTARSFPNAHSYAFLNKDHSGTWTVGDMVVRELRLNAGTIIVNGTMNNHGGINWSGGTLGGTGIVNEAVTVPAGGALAPGDPTGTLTITNNSCTINGSLDVEVNGPSYSILSVQNTLTISNATLNVNVGSSPGSDIVIATCGALVGEFAATNGLETWGIEYDVTGGKITLLPPAGGTVLIIR